MHACKAAIVKTLYVQNLKFIYMINRNFCCNDVLIMSYRSQARFTNIVYIYKLHLMMIETHFNVVRTLNPKVGNMYIIEKGPCVYI